MRGAIFSGGLALALILGLPLARAQVPNSPLYQLVPATPGWPSAPGMQGGQIYYAPAQAVPGVADRYPSDRSPALDNRAPALRPVGPDLRDSTLRLGSPLDNAARSASVRRPEGLQAPSSAGDPVRRGLRY